MAAQERDFEVQISWNMQEGTFEPGKYGTSHRIQYRETEGVNGSSAPEYGGAPNAVNPEQTLAAALASCHMMTFLALAAKSKWAVTAYQDNANAILAPGENKRPVVTEIILSPIVSFAEGAEIPTAEQLATLHEKAHKYCFVANSIKSHVTIKPQA